MQDRSCVHSAPQRAAHEFLYARGSRRLKFLQEAQDRDSSLRPTADNAQSPKSTSTRKLFRPSSSALRGLYRNRKLDRHDGAPSPHRSFGTPQDSEWLPCHDWLYAFCFSLGLYVVLERPRRSPSNLSLLVVFSVARVERVEDRALLRSSRNQLLPNFRGLPLYPGKPQNTRGSSESRESARRG